MGEWREARLIPTSGIKGASDQEVRATSALLSVLTVVPGFAHGFLKPCGAPLGRVRANVEAYIEVAFEDKKKKRSPRPDGLIRVTRGKKTWTALLEVKTKNNPLVKEQVEEYMDVAREQNFDAVITISNEIPPVLGSHPLVLDSTKLRSTPVYHYSWVRLISIAVMEYNVHGIEDPEQKWILGELIRYLEHENSGTLSFSDMGQSWTPFMDSVKQGLLRKNDDDVVDIAEKFDGLIRFLCLKLGQRLGVEVTPQLSRQHRGSASTRALALTQELEDDSSMSACIRIPNAVSDLEIRCDFRGRQILTFATVQASGHAKNSTRVNFLLSPLADDLTDVIIEAKAGRRTQSGTLEDFRTDIDEVLPDGFPEIRNFKISQIHTLGDGKTSQGKRSFINSVISAVDGYYENILQNLKVWTPPAPRYRKDAVENAQSETYSTAELSIEEADSNGADNIEQTS